MQEYQRVWQNCLHFIQSQIDISQFNTWFVPIIPKSLQENNLTIQVPNKFFYEWIEENYVALLTKVLQKELGPDGKLSYAIVVQSPENHSTAHTNTKKNTSTLEKKHTTPFGFPGITAKKKDSFLNKNYTFQNLVEGDCNQLAVSASKTVAKNPGKTAFNPLVIYGAVGLGKTHLVQAIGNIIKNENEKSFVLYVSSERFTNQFITAIKNNDIQNFLNFYLQVDVLMIDDIQFFNAKEKTQEIFFHVFNHLHQRHKQIIMTSDCPPRSLLGLQDRLLSRFKWGLTADLQPPDFETRMAIINIKIQQAQIHMPLLVMEYIAASVQSSVRELEGVIHSIVAHASLMKTTIDLSLTKKILSAIVEKLDDQDVKIDFIQKLTATNYKVSVEDIQNKSRKKQIVIARQVAMYFCKELSSYSLQQIGNFFGGRDHSTVIYAIQAIDNLLKENKDENFLNTFYTLKKKLTQKS